MTDPSPREGAIRAQALLEVGRPDEAASMLATALAADPSNADAWRLLAQAHLARDRKREALACARRAIALDPQSAVSQLLASVASLRRWRSREAVRTAREAVRLAPGLSVAHAQLATALAQRTVRGRREAAREAAHAVSLAADDPEIHFLAGNVALRLRKRRLAEKRFAKTLAIDPAHTGALNNLSVIRLRRGSTLVAASGFGQAAALDPATDLHRHNLDAATGNTLGYAAILLGGVAFLMAFWPIAGFAALVLFALLVHLTARRARRMLGPGAWAYVRDESLHCKVGLYVFLQFGMVTLAGAGSTPALAVPPFFYGVGMLVRMGFRRLAA